MKNTWPTTKLSEILIPVSRPTVVNPMEEYRLLGIRLDGGGAFHRETKIGSQSSATTLFRVQAGDFIYSRLFAWRGAFGVIRSSFNGYYVSSEFPTFMPIPEKIDINFLRLWFLLPTTIGIVEADCSGSTPLTRNRFKEHFFLNLEIPLPPLAEQRRIVARIEELAAKVEEARGLRKETVEEVEVFTGSATATLLRTLMNAEHATIEDIAEIRGGIQKGPHRTPGSNPVRYLTVAHVFRNRISLSDPRYFEVSPEELERWMLKPGDVLIIEGNGSADQVGRTALFRGEIDRCVHQNHVIRIRPDKKRIDPEFLNLYFNSPMGQEEVQQRSRTTSGLRNLSVGRIKQINIPIPSLPEQHRIVAYLDDLQARVDAVRQLQAETRAELDGLLPSILDKAFRGELV